MKKSENVWEERAAKERPPARSQPKYSWQVSPPSTQQEVQNDQPDLKADLKDQDIQNIAQEILLTDTKKVPVTSTKKEPVTSTKKVPVIKIETSTKKVTDTEKAPVATFRIPHQELDFLFKELDSGEFKLYLRLYRLSHGWGQESCKVGDNNLMETLNMSKNAIRSAKQGLTTKNLIQVLQIVNLGPKGYTEYRVIRVGDYQDKENLNWYQKGTSTKKVTDTEKDPNKYIDHDDLNKDHHQKEMMTIYQTLTGNTSWTKNDKISYEKIKHLSLQEVTTLIKSTLEKAHQKPASLAYFVKAYENPTQTNPANREANKRKIEAIMKKLRESHVGAIYTIADLAFDVKAKCVRDGIVFDNNLFNELLDKKNK
jgi:hypothetical protein